MRRGTMVSVCFLLGVSALLAAGQPPGTGPADKKVADKKAADKAPADPLDGLIGAALVNDPDVRMAQAKLQLADAELAKARQQVTLKVVLLHGAIQDQRRTIATLKAQLEVAEARFRAAIAPRTELIPIQEKFEAAQAALARSEAEIKLITGQRNGEAGGEAGGGAAPGIGVGGGGTGGDARMYAQWIEALRAWETRAVKGAIPNRIRAALDKNVSLGLKGQTVSFEKALEVFKAEAGLDVPVRIYFKTLGVDTQGEVLPVGAWFELFADRNPELRFVVREYGILVSTKDFAPPDAVTITQFWQMTRPSSQSPKSPGARWGQSDRPAGP